jgi:hypothetical protein
MATKITLVDSHTGVMWLRHLNWMAQHRGQLLWLIFEGEQLVEYLNSFVAHAVQYRGLTMQRNKMTGAEAEFEIMTNLLDQFTHNETTLEPQKLEEIMAFIETLEPNSVVVEV